VSVSREKILADAKEREIALLSEEFI